MLPLLPMLPSETLPPWPPIPPEGDTEAEPEETNLRSRGVPGVTAGVLGPDGVLQNIKNDQNNFVPNIPDRSK